MDDVLGIGPADRTDGDIPGFLAAGVADRAGLQPRASQRMEQAIDQAAIHQALMRGVGVAQQRLRSALGDDRLPPGGDLVERFVPADRLELARTLGAGALQRRGDAFGGVNQVGVAVHLPAGEARRVGMVGIALHAHDLAVLAARDQRAHVGAMLAPKRSVKRWTLPPRSMLWRTPVHAGWVLGSMSRRICAPSLPQVDLVSKVVPSVITTVIA